MRKLLAFFIFLAPFILPSPVSAHAFGQLYTLPIPIWLYLFGGGAALIVSFLIIGFFFNQHKLGFNYPQIDLTKVGTIRFIFNPFLKKLLQTFSLFFFAITILAGFIGSQQPTANLLPFSFWIFLFLGLTYLSALIGNFWDVINPFKIIAGFFLELPRKNKPLFKYPQKLGYLPALIIYFCLIWLELLSSGLGVIPKNLAFILIGYTFLNIIGSLFFGLATWFNYGEFFSIFFGLIAKLSPLEIRNRKIILRPPFVGLLSKTTGSFSLLLFILFMLSSTAFDGFRSTQVWLRFYYNNFRFLESYLGPNANEITQPLFLLLSPLFFLTLYFLALGVMKILVKTSLTIKELALRFAFSLLPIALAYNIAHYYTLVLVQGQSIIPLLSDPFNKGWNLFNTLSFKPNLGIISATLVWNSQVVVIIVGHIAAVYLAHLVALNLFPGGRKALLSQIPMLVLMVAYTMTGLWILSQPLMVGG